MPEPMRKPASRWQTFKFHPNTKESIVLRPLNVRWPLRFLLATLKTFETIPRRVFGSSLSQDCNERIVEYAFVYQKIGHPQGKRVLDFGCTESLLPIALATMGAKVVGVDLREYPFRHPNFTFKQGDFLKNEFDDNSFDVVVAVSAVEHCGLDVYGSDRYEHGDLAMMRQFRRLLRPGGLLLLTVPFGRAYIDSERRMYDTEQLEELLDGWNVRDKHYYRRGSDTSYWLQCAEEECREAGYHPISGVGGVVLVAATAE
jgi:SAM-dependent methyltransferase